MPRLQWCCFSSSKSHAVRTSEGVCRVWVRLFQRIYPVAVFLRVVQKYGWVVWHVSKISGIVRTVSFKSWIFWLLHLCYSIYCTVSSTVSFGVGYLKGTIRIFWLWPLSMYCMYVDVPTYPPYLSSLSFFTVRYVRLSRKDLGSFGV